jgi:hypothetical protein
MSMPHDVVLRIGSLGDPVLEMVDGTTGCNEVVQSGATVAPSLTTCGARCA